MNIELIVIGKTSENYLKIGIQDYLSKISRFCSISINVLKPHTNKSLSTNEIIKLEAKSIFQVIKPKDFLICPPSFEHLQQDLILPCYHNRNQIAQKARSLGT